MKRFLAAMSWMVILLTGGCPRESVHEVVPADGSFRIVFPCEPAAKTAFRDLGQNRVMKDATWACASGDGSRYSLYQGGISVPTESGFLYDLAAARKNITDGGGTIEGERKIEVGGQEGREFRIKSPNSTSLMRITVKELDVYVLEVSHPRGKGLTRADRRFFDSFQLRETIGR